MDLCRNPRPAVGAPLVLCLFLVVCLFVAPALAAGAPPCPAATASAATVAGMKIILIKDLNPNLPPVPDSAAPIPPLSRTPACCLTTGSIVTNLQTGESASFGAAVPLNWNHKFLFSGGGAYRAPVFQTLPNACSRGYPTDAAARGSTIVVTDDAHRSQTTSTVFATNNLWKDWLNRTSLTGDWGGARTRLQGRGINLRADFVTESAANPIGGKRQAIRYTQQVDFGADLDLNRLVGLSHGTVQITFTDRAGRSLSADAIGNQFAVQELYGAGQNFRLSELNYQQDLFAQKVTLEFGWAPVGDDFATLPILCDFQNVVACGHANAMAVNSGAHNFPTGEWGAHIKVRPVPQFYVATGLYQVNPNEDDSANGFDLSFHSTGAFFPVELGWMTGRGSGGLPGTYKIGAYYNSSHTPDVLTDLNGFSAGLTGAPFAIRNGRWGAYAIADQMVYRPGPDSKRGLRLGGLAGMGDRETAKYGYFLAGGGVYQGTFPGRDNDFVSFAVAYVRTNPRLTTFQEDRDTVAPGSVGVQRFESIVEVDYSVQLAPWFAIRPNLQYVIDPGGTGKISNAFVIGLYTSVIF